MAMKLFQSMLPTLRSLLTAQGDIPYASSGGIPARLARGLAGQILGVNAAGTLPEWISPTDPQIIINGDFNVWQRGISARTNTTTYSTDTSYAADRFFALPVGASITTQQSATVPDAKSMYSALLTGAASVTTVDYGQRIRSLIVNTRCLRSLVFSCYIRNVSGSAFIPKLRIGTPGSVDNFSTVTNRLDQSLQSCADSAWTRVTHVFDPSAYTNIANGMEVVLQIPSGSLVSGDTVYIAQFSLVPGTAFSEYVPMDPDLERIRANYYYQRFNGLGANTVFATGYAFSTSLGLMFLPLRQVMRTIPTLGYSVITDFSMSPGVVALASLVYDGADHGGRLLVNMTGTPLVDKQAYQLQAASGNTWLEVRAEL